jgi:hypothetical protein
MPKRKISEVVFEPSLKQIKNEPFIKKRKTNIYYVKCSLLY